MKRLYALICAGCVFAAVEVDAVYLAAASLACLAALDEIVNGQRTIVVTVRGPGDREEGR